MSSPPIIRAGGGSGKAKPKKLNAARRIMNQEQRVRERSAAFSPPASTPVPVPTSTRPVCKNPHCDKSDVRDGACQNCGRVVYESNIVAEVTFGETSSGAAVVHGSYLAHDQGSIRPSAGNLPFRRVAGAGAREARERSLREVKQLLSQFASQLQIPPHMAEEAFQFYKAASSTNFVQGRRKMTVAAVCLYAICRKKDNNRVMLIDLADMIKTDVFLLGRSYKDLLVAHPPMREGTKPIIIEDLIFRFASKLEFLHDTNKVALSAVRIAQRMRHDNITHGRRPAGICGAAIIMAARAHNYRRTVREVVYIAKVTMATLQERMEEFANVPAAQMTIAEFQTTDNFPAASHDPPFVYKQTEEWQKKNPKKVRKRKRKPASSTQDASPANNAPESPNAAKRHKTAPGETQTAAVPIDPALQPESDSTEVPSPSVPDPGSSAPIDETNHSANRKKLTDDDLSLVRAVTTDVDSQLPGLADEFGDSEEEEEEDGEGEEEQELDPNSEMAMAVAQGIQIPGMANLKIKPREALPPAGTGAQVTNDGAVDAAGKKNDKPTLTIDDAWELDENNLEREMEGHLNNPVLLGASASVARDIEQRREQGLSARPALPAPPSQPPAATNTGSSEAAAPASLPPPSGPDDVRSTPSSKVSDDPIVHEDEFKDDPEVMFCKLSERDVLLKEMIWANHNKDYMRKVQQKIFEAKTSGGSNSKKKSKNHGPNGSGTGGRAKKPRIGEGQATPAGSAAEAAENMLRARAISTKLDYARMGNLFEVSRGGPGSTYGGTTASSVGSRSALPSAAGSDAGSGDEEEEEEGKGEGRVGGSVTPTPTPTAADAAAAARERAARALAPPEEEEEEEEEGGGEDDMDGEGFQDETVGGEEEFDPFGDGNGGEEYEE